MQGCAGRTGLAQRRRNVPSGVGATTKPALQHGTSLKTEAAGSADNWRAYFMFFLSDMMCCKKEGSLWRHLDELQHVAAAGRGNAAGASLS
jgi:hypothetical protein